MMKRVSNLLASLMCIGSALAADAATHETAEYLWNRIEQLREAPPDEVLRNRFDDIRAATTEFEKRFPNDPRRWNAKLMQAELEYQRAQLDGTSADLTPLESAVREIAAASDASKDTKVTAAFTLLMARLERVEGGDATAEAALEKDLAAFRKQHPDDQRGDIVQMRLAQSYKPILPEKSESLLRELTRSKDPNVAADARQQLRVMETTRKLTKAPLDLKFTAVDGTAVDVAKLRGKVVLVDFWATWCGPCRMQVPKLVAAYNELHKDGFEIVGISFDSDKGRLLEYTKKSGMPWPQYFDGKTWQNAFGTQFGINAIPATWLVDKKGYVRTTEASQDLTQQVRKLLAE